MTRLKADPLAFRAQVPPETASVLYRSRYAWRDAEWLRRRAATDPLVAPMSIYEVHAGSWRQGPRLARPRRRAFRARRRGRVHPRRAHARDAASLRAVVGLPGDGLLRPAGDARRPGRPARVRRRNACERDRRPPRLGARPLPPRRVGPRPLRRDGALRARRPAAGRIRTGARSSSTSVGTRCGTSSWPMPSTGSRSSMRTACGSTPSPRCSTSTTRASPASGSRTAMAVARTSRRSRSSVS